MRTEVKVGDLWMYYRYDNTIPYAVMYVKTVLGKRKSSRYDTYLVETDSIWIEDCDIGLNQEEEIVPHLDRKITDPREKVYWLLRFENAK